MAITLKCKKYPEIVIDSNKIIGVLGNNYREFLKSFTGEDVYYLRKDKYNSITIIDDDELLEYRKLLKIDNVINKKQKDLSHSERRLLEYFLMVGSNSKIMIIDEPYLDLDYSEIKIINNLLKKLIKEGKTIIIGSSNINDIYMICKKVLLIGDEELLYDNVRCLTKKDILEKYHLDVPDIVEFVELAKKKNIKIPYSKDIRDLIKDVYRNVSKK